MRILPASIVFHASPASTASNASAIHFRAGLLSSSNSTVLAYVYGGTYGGVAQVPISGPGILHIARPEAR